jgi:hypothetical protein
MKMSLLSDVQLDALPRDELHAELEQLVTEFEQDFLRRAVAAGVGEGRLLQGERALLRDFIMYMYLPKDDPNAV